MPLPLKPGESPEACAVCGRASCVAGGSYYGDERHNFEWVEHYRLGYERLKSYGDRRGEEERAKALEEAALIAKRAHEDCFCVESDSPCAACMEAARIEGAIRGTADRSLAAAPSAPIAKLLAEERAKALEPLRAALDAFQKWGGYSQPWRKVRERVEYRSPVCEIAADGDLPVVLEDVPPLLADFIVAAYRLAAAPSGDAPAPGSK